MNFLHLDQNWEKVLRKIVFIVVKPQFLCITTFDIFSKNSVKFVRNLTMKLISNTWLSMLVALQQKPCKNVSKIALFLCGKRSSKFSYLYTSVFHKKFYEYSLECLVLLKKKTVDSLKCPDFIFEIPDTTQKVDCPPPKIQISYFFVATIRFSVKSYFSVIYRLQG